MTESTNLFSGSAQPSAEGDAAAAGQAADAPRDADRQTPAEGSSLGQDGAVRSWPGGRVAEDTGRNAGTGRLAAMLLPELQRLAQSLGISGTGRMRKGQLISAIEERQQGGAVVGGGHGEDSAAAADGATLTDSPPAAEPPPSSLEYSLTMLSCPDSCDSMASCSKGRLVPAPAGTVR